MFIENVLYTLSEGVLQANELESLELVKRVEFEKKVYPYRGYD